ncbi:lysophospholipase precursor [Sclerotinia borealis F-4128]|uniref:Lysophospholipase n=1 Tax=Sclerotinia borealis (strain F-4128) TaxID=1432307 RepID=W9C2R8_SCLBF|nr:lysophospholipase precursor [Sclerotinia borealis F-4128]
MKGFGAIVVSVALTSICDARRLVVPRDASPKIIAAEVLAAPMIAVKRALPDSPTGSYTPGAVDCPDTRPTIREASGLSANETSWLELRRNNTIQPMISFLERMNISGFDATSYINKVSGNASTLPNIGIAVSGGGYRALMNGAGFVAAADDRTSNSTNSGQIGGLLQATTYLAGLSGGGWLVGSIYTNNFSTVENLRDGSKGSDVWNFENSIFEGPNDDGIQILSTADYYKTIESQVSGKANAGLNLNTSITDYWGRALSFQLVNATDGGPAYTFSSIALQENFASGGIPMPFLVADGRSPYTEIVSLNSTVYEFNPFELGSWDPTTYAFAPLRYIGSNFTAGAIPNGQQCVRGFDQVGYVMGTSSTLFNQFLIQANASGLPTIITNAFTNILDKVGFTNNDIAQYQPNPFYEFNNDTNRIAQAAQLDLVDGGEDGQNIPLYPLIQPIRGVDVIFAVDSSADTTYGWPNGTALIATYQRSLNATIGNGTDFPAVPGQNTFVNLGLNKRPTFFGCDASNTTGVTPLVVYIPNAPYITQSNVSTFDPSYNNTQRNLIIENGYDVATMGNATIDPDWPTCVGCAIISRSLTKTNTAVPDACTTCFNRYCWNGTLDTSDVVYEPDYIIGEISAGVALDGSKFMSIIVAVTAAALVVFA